MEGSSCSARPNPEEKPDVTFVRDWARELFVEAVRSSIDPVVFFKLQLVMFFEGIRSERRFIATANLNLAHRWYLLHVRL
jgi:transposase